MGFKTNVKHLQCGFTNSSVCPLCGLHEETTLHIMRNCDKVYPTWLLIDFDFDFVLFGVHKLKWQVT